MMMTRRSFLATIALALTVVPCVLGQVPPPAVRPVVIQGAMDVETATLVRRLGVVREERVGEWTFWHGAIDGYPVIVSKTLKGVSNAAAATTIAVERFHPIAIVNHGTAGGVDPDLKLYDIVLGTATVNIGAFRSPRRAAGAGSNPLDWIPLDLTAKDGSAAAARRPARFAGDSALLAAARQVIPRHTRGRVVEGVIGTSDVWNDELDRLARFKTDLGLMVEEMEAASAAQVAAQLQVPFLSIRIVSDNAMTGLAFDPRTSEACADFVYEVVGAYIAGARRSSMASPRAGQLVVLASNAIKSGLDELLPELERTVNVRVTATYGLSARLRRQIDAGEPFDVAILTPALIDDLIGTGRIARDSRTAIARSPMALAVRTGAPKAEIKTIDQLKRVLTGAPSIAYASEGASAAYFTGLVERLGLAAVLEPKFLRTATGQDVGAAVAQGRAALGVLPTSEILPVPGIEVLAAFPSDVQGDVAMTAGVRAGGESRAAADLLKFLSSPAAKRVLVKKGFDPS